MKAMKKQTNMKIIDILDKHIKDLEHNKLYNLLFELEKNKFLLSQTELIAWDNKIQQELNTQDENLNLNLLPYCKSISEEFFNKFINKLSVINYDSTLLYNILIISIVSSTRNLYKNVKAQKISIETELNKKIKYEKKLFRLCIWNAWASGLFLIIK